MVIKKINEPETERHTQRQRREAERQRQAKRDKGRQETGGGLATQRLREMDGRKQTGSCWALSIVTPAAEQGGLGLTPSSPAKWKQQFLLGDLTMNEVTRF